MGTDYSKYEALWRKFIQTWSWADGTLLEGLLWSIYGEYAQARSGERRKQAEISGNFRFSVAYISVFMFHQMEKLNSRITQFKLLQARWLFCWRFFWACWLYTCVEDLILLFLFKSLICEQSYFRTDHLPWYSNLELSLAISCFFFHFYVCFELLKPPLWYELVLQILSTLENILEQLGPIYCVEKLSLNWPSCVRFRLHSSIRINC